MRPFGPGPCFIVIGLSAVGLILASEPAFAAGQYGPAVGQRPGNARSYDDPWFSTASASEPLAVSFAHHLNKREALRRVKSGLERIRTNYGFLFAVQEETWTGYHFTFRVSVLGQEADGTIDVTQRFVHLHAFLPWLLARLAEAALPAIRREGALILEGK